MRDCSTGGERIHEEAGTERKLQNFISDGGHQEEGLEKLIRNFLEEGKHTLIEGLKRMAKNDVFQRGPLHDQKTKGCRVSDLRKSVVHLEPGSRRMRGMGDNDEEGKSEGKKLSSRQERGGTPHPREKNTKCHRQVEL